MVKPLQGLFVYDILPRGTVSLCYTQPRAISKFLIGIKKSSKAAARLQEGINDDLLLVADLQETIQPLFLLPQSCGR